MGEAIYHFLLVYDKVPGKGVCQRPTIRDIRVGGQYTGMVVGSVRIPHITVADDLAVLSNSRNEM